MNKKYKVVLKQIGIWILVISGYILVQTLFALNTGYKLGYFFDLIVLFIIVKCCSKVKENYEIKSMVEESKSQEPETELNNNSKFCSLDGKKKKLKVLKYFLFVIILLLFVVVSYQLEHAAQERKNNTKTTKSINSNYKYKTITTPKITKFEISDFEIPSFEYYTNSATYRRTTVSYTVYITEYGSKYHRYSCGSLYNSKYSISIDEAIAHGYSPCSRCHP